MMMHAINVKKEAGKWNLRVIIESDGCLRDCYMFGVDNDNDKYHSLNDGHIICSSVLLLSMLSIY